MSLALTIDHSRVPHASADTALWLAALDHA